MTMLILIAPKQEVEIHGFKIFENSDVKKIEDFIRSKEAEYGEIDRILVNGGITQIMDPKDHIPVPLLAGKTR